MKHGLQTALNTQQGFFLLIIYFWLHRVFIAARGLSLVAASRGCSHVAVLLLLRSTGSRVNGLQQLRLVGSRAQAQ